jgi:ADP-ribose pyrophosphatase YjhB (NUDIX family)
MAEIWKPHVVVAAVVEREGRHLLVEERTPEGLRINQPAGHLEPGESVIDAVRREVLEETARRFEPSALIGIYRLPAAGRRPDFLRFTFCGTVSEPDSKRALDADILRAEWFSESDIRAHPERHRSPLVMASIEDYLRGLRYPLTLLRESAS